MVMLGVKAANSSGTCVFNFIASAICEGRFADISYCAVRWGGLHRNLAMHLTFKNKSTVAGLCIC